MKSFDLIPLGEEENPHKHRNGLKNCFHRFIRSFRITGERRVKRHKLTSEDFDLDLPEDYKVAKYDSRLVAKYWNERNLSRSIGQFCFHLFLRGIYAKLVPVTTLYIILYYVLNMFVFNYALCTPDCNANNANGNSNFSCGIQPNDPGLVRTSLSGTWLCKRAKLEAYMAMERDFTRVLTLFIGFTVSISVNSWFSQVRMMPKLDQILVQIPNYLWVNPKENADDVKVKGDLTAKQLSITIIRYFLLSWTMCFSRMSTPLYEKFKNAHELNNKKLMLKREFDELCWNGLDSDKTGTDRWREKWSTPLSWVTKMVNDIGKVDKTEPDKVKVLDIKDAIGKTVGAYCQDLQKINSYNEYRLPTSLINLLTLTIYVFLILNVAAAQDLHPEKEETEIGKKILMFAFDFPVYPLVKYLLIFGWLKVATDLMVPFGNSR